MVDELPASKFDVIQAWTYTYVGNAPVVLYNMPCHTKTPNGLDLRRKDSVILNRVNTSFKAEYISNLDIYL